MLSFRAIVLLIILPLAFRANAQTGNEQGDTLVAPAIVLSSHYIDQVAAKSGKLNHQLDKKTNKLLRRWQKEERRIAGRLGRVDSIGASQLTTGLQERLNTLKQGVVQGAAPGNYIPSLDTLSSSLHFLQQHPAFFKNNKLPVGKLQSAIGQSAQLGDRFQQAEQVKRFIAERKQLLRERLENLGFAKQLRRLNKQAYYYSAQVEEYKSLLKDHRKAERKALEYLSKTKLFKDFMRKNSQLASLFRLPGNAVDPGSAASLAGLQTRVQVNNLIQQQLAAGGPNALSQAQQNMQEAQARLNELKDKVLKLGGSSGDMNMPEGFKPNDQKTKSLWKRLQFGSNIQSQRARGYFPATTDVGLSIGYKLNDRSIIGIGGSYKLGLGRDIRHVKVSHQGVGLRSFVDWKIKGSFWLSGGYEMNYRSEFRSIQQLQSFDAWQRSGLIGLSKVVSLKTKVLKQTKVQLMWDFLSYQSRPQTQPIIFRVGYNF